MDQIQVSQFININNFMKKPNSAYILSVIFLSFSLGFLSLYNLISSSDLCGSVVSGMRFSIGRNHVFLLCNGILVILVKSSSSPSSSSSSSSSFSSRESDSADYQIISNSKVLEDSHKMVKQVSEMSAEQKGNADDSEAHFLIPEEKAAVTAELVVEELECPEQHFDDADDKNDHHARNNCDNDDEEVHEEDAEELNRRCEDFIRRMKQGIISESRQYHDLARFS